MSQTESNGKISGSCACGKIKFTTEYIPKSVANCYCVQCRKCSGSDRLPFVNFPSSLITWETYPDIWNSSDFAERGYCATCGSAISMTYKWQREEIGINTGIIDSGFDFIPPTTYHIFVEEKAPWVTIPDDGARKVEGFGTEFRKKLEKWKKENVKTSDT